MMESGNRFLQLLRMAFVFILFIGREHATSTGLLAGEVKRLVYAFLSFGGCSVALLLGDPLLHHRGGLMAWDDHRSSGAATRRHAYTTR